MFKYVRHAAVVEIVGLDREKLNGFQTVETRYMLVEIIWRNRNKFQ
jgi:hypothetical protein